MTALFSPLRLAEVALHNRIVVGPMCQYSATDGVASHWHMVHLGQFALGGAALVFIEATAVSRTGRITPGCLGLYGEEQEAALKPIVDFYRRHGGGTRLGIQLSHAGRKAASTRPWEQPRWDMPLEDGREWVLSAPSPVPHAPGRPAPQEMSVGDMEQVKADFVAATRRADRLGLDLVEMHAAHGYLLHQFLSPVANRRGDGYGGGIRGRMRFPLEVAEAMRAAWPRHKPLAVRVSATDWVEGGWDVEDTVVLANALREIGCDLVDVSSGGVSDGQKIDAHPGYQVPLAARVRAGAGIATMATGLINRPEMAEAVVAGGGADLVALARGMLADPRWTWRAAGRLGAHALVPLQYLRGAPVGAVAALQRS